MESHINLKRKLTEDVFKHSNLKYGLRFWLLILPYDQLMPIYVQHSPPFSLRASYHQGARP